MMEKPVSFESLLVPVDFSASSAAAFQHALELAAGENKVIILLHAIDPAYVQFAVDHDFGSAADVTDRMKARAMEQLQDWKSRVAQDVEVDIVVSEGIPFLEILRKAEDFIVDAVVMGKIGTRGRVEQLLFGSTAEKVLRGSTRPVLTLPHDTSS